LVLLVVAYPRDFFIESLMAAGTDISSFMNEGIDWSGIPIPHKYLLVSIIFNMQFMMTMRTKKSRWVEIQYRYVLFYIRQRAL